jgi:hypothetical protein
LCFATLSFFAHYIIGGTLLLCLGIWQLALSVPTPRTLRVLPAILVAVGGACMMLWPQISSLVTRAGQLSFTSHPTLLDLAGAFVTAPVCLLVLGLFISRRHLAQGEESGFHEKYPFLFFLVLLGVIPPVALYLVSISWKSLWVERYYADYAVAVSILGACALARLQERRAILTLGLAVLFAAAVERTTGDARQEGWREAVQAVRSDQTLRNCPLFFSSGFIETARSRVFSQPTLAGFVRAPLSYYQVDLPIIDLPLHFAGKEEGDYFSMVVAPALDSAACAVVMARTMYFWHALGNYLPSHLAVEQALEERGFRQSQESSFLNVTVSQFRRGADIHSNQAEADQVMRRGDR